MGWIIALVILTGLAILPLGISVRYQTGSPAVHMYLGPVRLPVFPRKKKQAKAKIKKLCTKPKVPAKKSQKPDEKGGSITDFLPLVGRILDFLCDFKGSIRINQLELKLILGGGDPCDLAVNYGRAWAALGNLMPQLERLFIIRKRNLEVECDFTSSETRVFARLELCITLGRLLRLVTHHGFHVVREYLSIMKLRKGGVKT